MALATHVRARLDALSAEFGQAGDERLMLMAALLTADELFEARDRIAELEQTREAETETAAASAAKGRTTGPVKPETGGKAGTA